MATYSKSNTKKSNKKFNKRSNNENANEKASQQNQEMKAAEEEEEKLKRKTYELSPEWKILSIAKKKFLSLPTDLQDSKAKSACVDYALAEHKKIMPDSQRFWMWIVDEKKKFFRVWDFDEVCKSLNRDPHSVAENLLFEGKMASQTVRLDGLASYGSKAAMYKERLFVDKFNLFETTAPITNSANE